jgi:hypothetical protein
MNAELEYRRGLLRVWHRILRDAEKAQAACDNSAWRRFVEWADEFLLEGARESLAELGPLGSLAQGRELEDFFESEEAPEKAA